MVDSIEDGPKLKIERAKHHVNNLNGKMDAYLAQKPFKLMAYHQPKLRNITFKVKTEKPIPPDFALIIGDAIHNLRSALDLIIFAIVGHKSTSPHNVKFPFPVKEDGLEGAINNAHVNFAPKKVVDEIRALKPYPGGNEILCGVHRLDLCDKHRILILTGQYVDIVANQMQLLHPSLTRIQGEGMLRFSHDQPIVINDVFFGSRSARRRMGDFQQETDFQPPFGVCFGKGLPFEGDPVIPKLIEMTKSVEIAVNRIVKSAR